MCFTVLYIILFVTSGHHYYSRQHAVGWLSVEVIYFFLKKYFYLNGKHVFFFYKHLFSAVTAVRATLYLLNDAFDQDFSSNKFIMFVACTSIRNALSNYYYNYLYDYYIIAYQVYTYSEICLFNINIKYIYIYV